MVNVTIKFFGVRHGSEVAKMQKINFKAKIDSITTVKQQLRVKLILRQSPFREIFEEFSVLDKRFVYKISGEKPS